MTIYSVLRCAINYCFTGGGHILSDRDYGVGVYGTEWVHNREPKRSRMHNQLVNNKVKNSTNISSYRPLLRVKNITNISSYKPFVTRTSRLPSV